MADGSIVFATRLDNKNLEKDLNATRRKIQSIKEKIYKSEAQRLPLLEQSRQLSVELDKAQAKLAMMQNARPGKYSNDVLKEQSDYVRKLFSEYNSVENRIDSINRSLESSNISLDLEQQKAGYLEKELAKSAAETNKVETGTKKTSRAMDELGKRTRHFRNRLREIVTGALFFNIISAGLRKMIQWFSTSIQSSEEARAAIAGLQGALLTLAQPILQVVIPAFVSLVNVLARVVTAIASFVAGLFGQTVTGAASAAESLYNEANALESVGGAAKEAQQNLSGLDEINTFQSDSGGGGGGGGSLNGIVPDFDIGEGGLLSGLLNFTLEDILFDWSDLSAENIIAKIITGLTTIAGGMIGFAIGGPGGAVIGATIGLGLGMILSSLIMDNDGNLSNTEIRNALVTALSLIAGAGIGFALGGPMGAAIGLTVTAGLIVFLNAINLDNTSYFSDMDKMLEEHAQFNIDAKAHVKTLTGEIDDETKFKLDRAEELIAEIFDLDSKDNKTSKELAKIQGIITELNGLGLEGLQDAFQVTKDGYVIPTREEAEALIDTLRQQYTLKALEEDYTAALEGRYKASKNLNEIESKLSTTQTKLKSLENQRTTINKKLAAETDKTSSSAQILLQELEKVNVEYDNQDEALGELQNQLSETQDTYNSYSATVSELEGEMFNIRSETDKQTDATENLESSTKDLGNAMEQTSQKSDTFGKTMTERYAEGIKSGTEETNKAAKEVRSNVLEGLSAEELAKIQGANASSGFSSGVKSGGPTAKKAGEEVGVSAANAMNQSDVANSSGRGVTDGMKSGLTSGKQGVLSAMGAITGGMDSMMASFCTNAARNLYNAVKNMIKILQSVNIKNGTISGPVYGIWKLNINGLLSDIDDIKHLASGAVIPPNREFLAVLGDQKTGTNIETPEGLLRQIMREELGSTGRGNTYNVSAVANGRVILRMILEEGREMQMESGRNPFNLEA